MSNTVPPRVCDAAVILGVDASVSALELKVAYCKAILSNHPSLHPAAADAAFLTTRRRQACLALGVLGAYRNNRPFDVIGDMLQEITNELTEMVSVRESAPSESSARFHASLTQSLRGQLVDTHV